MTAPGMTRFISIVSSAATQVGSSSRRSRRLAVALPMAAIAAVGVVGATPLTSGATTVRTVSAPVSQPAAPAPAPAATAADTAEPVAPQPVAPSAPPAAPVAEAPAAPVAPAAAPRARAAAPAPAKSSATARPSAAPSTAPAAAEAPAALQLPAPVRLQPGEGVSVDIRSLTDGKPVQPGVGGAEFTVTWTNTASVELPVSPVVHALPFDRPANCTGFSPTAAGDLMRKDETGWAAVDLAGDGTTAQGGEFALAAGASRTVRYRLELTGDNGPGTLPIVAQAYLPSGATRTKVGESQLALDVTAPHTPTAVMPVKPTALTIGHIPSTLRIDVANPDCAVISDAGPYLTMIDPFSPGRSVHVLTPADVTVEVSENGAWRTLPTAYDQNQMVKVDTSSLRKNLAGGEKVSYEFHIGIRQYWSEGNGIEFTVGASGEGTDTGFQTVRPQTWYPMADLKPAQF